MKISRVLKQDTPVAEPAAFQIYSIQSLQAGIKKGETPFFCVDMFLMIWILEGSVKIGVDTDAFHVSENVFFYVTPGQVFTMEIDEAAKGYAISFAKEYIELTDIRVAGLFRTSFFNQFNSIPIIYIWGDSIVAMESFADKMIQEYNNTLDLRSDILKGYLKIFMIYLCRQIKQNIQDIQDIYWSRKNHLVKLFFTQVEKYYASKKMVKEYAEILAVSPGYLNGVVKEMSGRTASHHIQQRIVLEAKRRVLHDGFSLKETAYDLGFWDPAHFSKYFKNCSGINFTDFKKGVSI
ncbi:helix-turn-helix domain-containing protein [Chitinophaga pinensis]|uniref:Transcriptional regulator, AraC family n=1 Tax=Chitinophaga pinensis (strain ATCC 43595 / DSM 2588 / LMG 13176 / NBRC 15968 / NCIMB 11800 / UQM 2034) TaxID=485918 RepID=A0A979FZ22_CHIPD|nr:helix-turn-helix domain-containing protein [Chitinophaga pinensis]ACU57763.1 transcriptional regulator, AraC family [Chitinophaga pinensis DSM 2588]